jgi:hypothetical protein
VKAWSALLCTWLTVPPGGIMVVTLPAREPRGLAVTLAEDISGGLPTGISLGVLRWYVLPNWRKARAWHRTL